MNHKTRQLAQRMYDAWREDIQCIAPPGSYISPMCWPNWRREAVVLKKTLEYRKGLHPMCEENQ